MSSKVNTPASPIAHASRIHPYPHHVHNSFLLQVPAPPGFVLVSDATQKQKQKAKSNTKAKQQQINLKQRDFYDDIHVQRLETTGFFNLDSIDDQFDEDQESSEPEVDELLHNELPLS